MLGRMVRKSLLNNAGSSGWTLTALIICAALVAMFATTALEVREKMTRTLRQMGANAVAYPATASATLLPAASQAAADWTAFAALTQSRGVASVVLQLRVGTVAGRPVPVVVAAPNRLQPMTPYWTVTGRRPTAPDECLAGKRVAEALQLAPGGEVTVQWPGPSGQTRYRVVGLAASGDEDDDRLFATSFQAQAVSSEAPPALPAGHPDLSVPVRGQPVDCSSCHASTSPEKEKAVLENVPRPTESPDRPDSGNGFVQSFKEPYVNNGSVPFAALSGSQPSQGESHLLTVPKSGKTGSFSPYLPISHSPISYTYALLSVSGGETEIVSLQGQLHAIRIDLRPLRQILHGEQIVLSKVDLLSGMALFAVVALTAIGVSVSALVRVVERRRELALLQALGGKRRAIVGFLLAESAILGAVASAAGFLLGTFLSRLVVQDVFRASVAPHWAAFGAVLGTTLIVSLLAGAVASVRALRFQPAVALKGE